MPESTQPTQLTIVTNRQGVETQEVVAPAPKAKIKVGDYAEVYLKRVNALLAADTSKK